MGEFIAKTVADTKAFEQVPINERLEVYNTYDLLQALKETKKMIKTGGNTNGEKAS